jgi:hypothetical protein
MKQRPLCQLCRKKVAAINYYRHGKVYFRTHCDSCKRKKRGIKPPIPTWYKSGYKRKPNCEKCGFKAKYKEQLNVYHVDGNLSNASWSNLKTVCTNCQIEIANEGLGWRQGDLVPDF